MRPESRIASSPYCPSATRAKTSPSREHHAEPEQVSEAKVANRETLSSRSPTTRSILFNRHAKSQLTWEERRVSSPLGWVSFQRNRPDPSTTRLGALRSGFRQKAPARLMPRSRLLSGSRQILRLRARVALRSGFRQKAPARLAPRSRLLIASRQILRLRARAALRSGFRLRAPAAPRKLGLLTPAKRLKTDPSTPRQGGATLRISAEGSRSAGASLTPSKRLKLLRCIQGLPYRFCSPNREECFSSRDRISCKRRLSIHENYLFSCDLTDIRGFCDGAVGSRRRAESAYPTTFRHRGDSPGWRFDAAARDGLGFVFRARESQGQ